MSTSGVDTRVAPEVLSGPRALGAVISNWRVAHRVNASTFFTVAMPYVVVVAFCSGLVVSASRALVGSQNGHDFWAWLIFVLIAVVPLIRLMIWRMRDAGSPLWLPVVLVLGLVACVGAFLVCVIFALADAFAGIFSGTHSGSFPVLAALGIVSVFAFFGVLGYLVAVLARPSATEAQ